MSQSLNPADCRMSGDRYRLVEWADARVRIQRARELAYLAKCRAQGRVPIADFRQPEPPTPAPASSGVTTAARVRKLLAAIAALLEGAL